MNLNIALAAVFVVLGSGFAIALIEPTFMRWLCAHGLSWAACMEAFRRSRPKETQYWSRILSTPRDSLVQVPTNELDRLIESANPGGEA